MTQRWVVCLKHGTKYSSEYVNKLYSMTKRHSTMPFNFACITENAHGLDPNIKIIPLPQDNKLSGWWYKPYVFSTEIPIDGTILFLDLDLVIVRNFDYLWTYEPEKFCIIRDFARSRVKHWHKFNSSVFRLEKGQHAHVWNNLISDYSPVKKMHGDQDWIYNQITKNFSFWPDQWIQSYRWEVRSKSELVGVNSGRRFSTVKNPKVDYETSILVFHGDPKPSEVKDPIIIDNWR